MSDLRGPAAVFEQMWRASEKECEELRARVAELEAALEDAIDTLEAMDLHDNPLYGRLRAAVAKEGNDGN